MAARIAARYVSRRLSTGGKVLGEEEKAAENVYIKKIEKEKLEKLARQGTKPEEPATTASGSASDVAKPSSPASPPTGVSTNKERNYAGLAGVITAAAVGLGWYLIRGYEKPPEEVVD